MGTVNGSVKATHVKCCNLRLPEAESVISTLTETPMQSLKLVNLSLAVFSRFYCRYLTVLSTRSVLWASNMPKMRWRPGLRPGPRWGSSRRSPDPLVGCGGGHPLPIPIPLAPRFSRLQRCSFCGPQCKILATPLFDLVTLNT